MFTPTLPLILLQVLTNLLWILAQAASAAPIIIIFCLLVARRSQVKLALNGAYTVGKIGATLTFLAPLAIAGELVVLLQELNQLGQNWQMPSIFDPALANYTISSLIWLGAGCFSLILSQALKRQQKFVDQAKLPLKQTALALILASLTLAIFFVGYGALAYPFAGLPAGLKLADALIAVAGQAKHQHFISVLPATLIFLSLLPRCLNQKTLPQADLYLGKRFLAGIGLACALPTALSTWGTVLGYLLRKDIPFQILIQLGSNACLTITLIFLGIITFGKLQKYQPILQILAQIFFLLSAILPAIFLLRRYF